MGYFLPGRVISQVHGREQRASGEWGTGQLFLPLYHPAAALYNPNMKRVHLEDFQKITKLLKGVRARER
jgi:DNA polymerase